MSGRVGAPPASAVSSRRQLPGPIYWGWVMVAALGVTECVSYGVLSYAFAIFLHPMERDLGWSRAQLTGAFSVAWLVAGLAAVPLGRWIDRHGARLVMTAGSLLAALLLVAWSRVDRLASFYAIWLGLGLACAAVLYEPAFAVVATWFDRRRTSALTLLTFLGGLASVVFVPLASWLVQRHGWRGALVWLAAILAAVTVPAHALLLRRRPQDHGLLPDGALVCRNRRSRASTTYQPKPSLATSQALGSRSFAYLSVAFALSTMASTAMTVHLVPLLLDRGQPPAFAAAAMAGVGLMALPGRLVFTPLGGRWPRAAVTASIFAAQALAMAALLGSGSTTAVWVFVALFGAGFGAITPARAALVAELYGASSYASISGVMALVLAAARAVAPLGASLLERAGGYGAVLLVVLAMSLASGVLTLLAGRSEPAGALVERAA